MRQNWLIVLIVSLPFGIAVLANTGLLPQGIRRIYDFQYGDKVGHFLLMGLVNFALNWAVLVSRPRPGFALIILKTSLLFAFLVTLEELSQQFFPRRTFSLLDLGFSYFGIFFAALLIWRLKRQT